MSGLDQFIQPTDAFHARQYASLSLAYLGDAVQELYVRSRVLSSGDQKVVMLHKQAVSFVKANAQAQAVDGLMDELTPDELDVFKRGRNTKSTPTKNTDQEHYRKATGFECILGYLYISGQQDRLMYLLDKAYKMIEQNRGEL